MPKLIVQADDLAITHATTVGIIDAIEHGLVRATGIFTNRPDAVFAAAALAGIDGVDVGIDFNVVTGSPLLPAERVPSLVRPGGTFRSSGDIKAGYRLRGPDGIYVEFEEEPFDHDQTSAEFHAQLERFFELFGRPPAYVHHHSLVTPMLDQVIHEVADEHGLLVMDDLLKSTTSWWVPNTWYDRPFGAVEQAGADPIALFEAELEQIAANELSILVVHPGFVDAELLDITSYHVIRARDHQLATSPRIAGRLAELGIEVTNFSGAGLT